MAGACEGTCLKSRGSVDAIVFSQLLLQRVFRDVGFVGQRAEVVASREDGRGRRLLVYPRKSQLTANRRHNNCRCTCPKLVSNQRALAGKQRANLGRLSDFAPRRTEVKNQSYGWSPLFLGEIRRSRTVPCTENCLSPVAASNSFCGG